MTGFTITFKKRKKYIYFLPVIIIAIFSLLVYKTYSEKEKENIVNETSDIQVFREINDYSAYYNPIVINKLFSYKQGDKIENEKLLHIALWSILCSESKEKYEIFDGELSIPEEDIKDRVAQLFSEKAEFENISTDRIAYDSKNRCYNVPTMGFFPEYSALLKSVTAEKDRIRLSVECLRSDGFKQDSSGKTVFPEAEKNIIIILKKSKSSYYIESIYEE